MAKWTVVTQGNPRGWLIVGKVLSAAPSYNGDRIRWEIESDGEKSLLVRLKEGILTISETR